MEGEKFDVTPLTKVKRLPKRAVYDKEQAAPNPRRGTADPIHLQASKLALLCLAPTASRIAGHLGDIDKNEYRTALLGGLRAALGSTSDIRAEAVISAPNARGPRKVLLDDAFDQVKFSAQSSLFGYTLVTEHDERSTGKSSFDGDRIVISDLLNIATADNEGRIVGGRVQAIVRELLKLKPGEVPTNPSIYLNLASSADRLVDRLGGSLIRATMTQEWETAPATGGLEQEKRLTAAQRRYTNFVDEAKKRGLTIGYALDTKAANGPRWNKKTAFDTERWFRLVIEGEGGATLETFVYVIATDMPVPRMFRFTARKTEGGGLVRIMEGEGQFISLSFLASTDEALEFAPIASAAVGLIADAYACPIAEESVVIVDRHANAMVYAEVFGSVTISAGEQRVGPTGLEIEGWRKVVAHARPNAPVDPRIGRLRNKTVQMIARGQVTIDAEKTTSLVKSDLLKVANRRAGIVAGEMDEEERA